MAILQKGLILYDFFALIGFLIRGVHRVGKVKIAIFATLLSIGLHSYLSWNYYPLKFAQASGDSLCNFNELFNCDAVAASSFSTLLGIPLAVC